MSRQGLTILGAEFIVAALVAVCVRWDEGAAFLRICLNNELFTFKVAPILKRNMMTVVG
jgi:hypothetical protein